MITATIIWIVIVLIVVVIIAASELVASASAAVAAAVIVKTKWTYCQQAPEDRLQKLAQREYQNSNTCINLDAAECNM